MRAITVAVDYHDLLAVTLPANHHQFDSITVITSPSFYIATCGVCYPYGNVNVLATDLFYRDGAHFAKYRAIEWGLDQMGRDGWLCHLDADIIIPASVNLKDCEGKYLKRGYLYTPLRRMLDPVPMRDGRPVILEEKDWGRLPLHMQLREWAGYCQIYHASDERLGKPPWHDISWSHCGGGDSFFQAKWPAEYKIRPSWEVLHLDRPGVNWCGRGTPRLDGSTPPESVQRISELRNMIRKRGHGSDRYRLEKVVVTHQIDSETSGPTETTRPSP